MGADGKKSPIPSGWRPWMSGDVRLKENPDTDFFLQTKEDYGQTIFDKLLRARRDRKYGYSGDAAKYLQNIVDEIKLHTKITALSIFGIGELLFEAKRLIAKKTVKGPFQDWIGENFDFSYDRAQKFMHVFECCFGRRQLLEGVKPTMLYKVSEPSFPEELRNALLSNGAEALRKLTNRDVDKLAKQCETEGWDGIAGTVEQVCDVYVDMQEIQYGLSLLYQICRDLETRKAQLNKHLSGRVG